jgi:probable HAF family extracellular repeat protein
MLEMLSSFSSFYEPWSLPMFTKPNLAWPFARPVHWAMLAAAAVAAAGWDDVKLSAGGPPPGTHYTVEDLGKLPGSTATVAWGINSGGDVVGWATTANGTRAFLYTDDGGMVALPGLTVNGTSLARDINDNRVVVGQSNGRAARWDANGTVENLGSLFGEADALAINSLNQVVGWSYTDASILNVHGFLYTPGEGMVDITPTGQPGSAWDINDAGQVAGYANSQAFRWQNGQYLWLGALPDHAYSFGFGINAWGDVTGSSKTASGNTERIFRFTDANGMQNLGGSGESNFGRRMNSSGQVVGTGKVGSLESGVVYTDGVGLQDLNALITSPGEWFILDATDINDEGVIAATASSNFLQEVHAVRLRPTTESDCDGHCMHSAITLKAAGRRAVGIVTAEVSVSDQDGVPIAGANVLGHWTPPSGSSVTVVAETNGDGVVRFSLTGRPGQYTFTIDLIEYTGYTYDEANSEVSQSITR